MFSFQAKLGWQDCALYRWCAADHLCDLLHSVRSLQKVRGRRIVETRRNRERKLILSLSFLSARFIEEGQKDLPPGGITGMVKDAGNAGKNAVQNVADGTGRLVSPTHV